MTTTLWSYPSQHYQSLDGASIGRGTQGDPLYTGATPSWVIWQVLTRFTREGERVLDPMCGSGTTLDVCRDLGRRGRGFDIAPSRDDIEPADARSLPIEDESADCVFIDPPYSTHVRYSGHERCIGELDAMPTSPDAGAGYYEAMHQVIGECARVLRPGRHLALYVSDSFKKSKRGVAFAPIGFELFAIMRERLEPVDIVCVERGNRKLKRGHWNRAAEEGGFMMRGFNYLFLMRRPV
ncbi:MAG: DNA methyltransferase [Planctomycetota bacterium]